MNTRSVTTRIILLTIVSNFIPIFILAQNVGIGTSTPSGKLHVNGTLKVTDGTQGAGKILTSDASGLASWQPPPPAEPSSTYYPGISICCQTWMAKNLDVATYRNGDAVPKVTNAAEWAALTTGAYCYYNNDSATYAAVYGKMYNWYAVNDPRGLAPEGWHIPSDFEWTTLGDCLGGNGVAGGHLKEPGTIHWSSPNTGATNITNFTAVPGGYRDDENGSFNGLGAYVTFWSSLEYTPVPAGAWARTLSSGIDDLGVIALDKNYGYYVRCVKD